MKTVPLVRWLLVLAVLTAAGLAVVFRSIPAARRDELTLELGKGLVQLMIVVLLGAAVKLLVDRYQDEQRRAELDRQQREAKDEQNRAFRQDKYERLVQATNQLRRAPILIDANRSVKTWSEQMLAVIEAGLDLRMLKHQIWSSRGSADPPLPGHAELARLFELMYHYTDWVTADFAENKKRLSELQRRAEQPDLSGPERTARQDEVWAGIRTLPSVADMLREPTDAERQACRTQIQVHLADPRQAPPESSWVAYQEAESVALERITLATLARPGAAPPAGAE